MKKKFIILLCAIISNSCFGYDFNIDGIYYNILSDKDKTCAVTYGGSSIPEYGETASFYKGDIVIPETVMVRGESYKVTAIDECAFYCCKYVTNIKIPPTVKSVRQAAFVCCTSLKSFSFSEGVEYVDAGIFDGCTSLESVHFSNSVSRINQDALFCYCTSLKSITVSEENRNYKSTNNCLLSKDGKTLYRGCRTSVIPEGVENIAADAFDGCETLEFINIPHSVTYIGSYAFWKCTSLKGNFDLSSVKNLGEGAFEFTQIESVKLSQVNTLNKYVFSCCRKLKTVSLAESLSYIGYGAFSNCDSLTSINIPNSVKRIDEYAFSNCTSIENIKVPSGVTQIGSSAFGGILNVEYDGVANGSNWGALYLNKYYDNHIVYEDSSKKKLLRCSQNCSGKIFVPEGVTTIGNMAFSDCNKIISLTLPSTITTLGEKTDRYIEKNIFEGCTGHLNVNFNIPDQGKYFTKSQFTSVTFGKGVTSIGNQAFAGCATLESVDFPEGLTYIGKAAFSDCYKLSSIEIPQSVTKVGSSAFYNCTGLTTLTLSSNLATIENAAFYNCSRIKRIELPSSLKEIGSSAFNNCSELISVNIPDGVESIGYTAFEGILNVNYHGVATGAPWGADFLNKYFDGVFLYENSKCDNLLSWTKNVPNNAVIPNTVKTIGNNAFSKGTSLISLTLPENLSSIGEYAFSKCVNLTELTIPKNVNMIGRMALPTSLKKVVWYAKHCADFTQETTPLYNGALETLIIGDGVEYIPAFLTYNQKSLKTLHMSTSVNAVGTTPLNGSNLNDVYINCRDSADFESYLKRNDLKVFHIKDKKLTNHHLMVGGMEITEVVFPDGETTVKAYTFKGCTMLKSIKLPENVKSISSYAFYNCYQANINFPTTLRSIGSYAFNGCSNLPKTLFLPNVTSVGAHAFDMLIYEATGGSNMVTLELPNVTTIGDYAFHCNFQLKNINIHKAKTIGNYAFKECNPETIILGEQVEKIGEYVFQWCFNIKNIYNLSSTPQTITSNIFSKSLSEMLLHVKKGLKDIFSQASVWQEFTIVDDADDLINNEIALAVDNKISAIGTVEYTDACKNKIDAARSAYEALTKDQQALVTKLSILTDAEKKYAEIAEAIEKTIKAVKDLINAIGKVEYTDVCKEKIDAARNAYDALPKNQQALVKNYNDLLEAEDAYNKIDASTGIEYINTETNMKDGKYLKNGKIVIIKNGGQYNTNGLLNFKR